MLTEKLRDQVNVMKEQQSRGYIMGRIGKKDPWARQLAQQLNERVARFLVLAYD